MDDARKGLIERIRTKRTRFEKLKPANTQHIQSQQSPSPPGVDSTQILRETRFDTLGPAPWGAHFCLLYENKQDLIDVLVPYFKAGLENNELCVWIIGPLSRKEALEALKRTVPDLKEFQRKRQIEIITHAGWYLKDNTFNPKILLEKWVQKLNYARTKGFSGIRVTGDGSVFDEGGLRALAEYEKQINQTIGDTRIIAICTYQSDKCSAVGLVDVISNHQSAIVKRQGKWEVVENTGRKRALEALKESEEKFKAIAENSPDVIARQEKDSKYLYINPVAEKEMGISPETFIGKTNRELGLPEEICAFFDKKLAEVYDTKEAKSFDLQSKMGGGVKFYQSIAVPEFDSTGQVKSVLTLSRNITERKRAQEALWASEEKYRQVVSTTIDAVMLFDPETRRFIDVNPACEKLYGYTKKEFLNLTQTEITAEPEKSDLSIKKTAKGQLHKIDLRYHRKKDGTIFPVEISGSTFDLDGKRVVCGVIRDITEREKNESVLKQERTLLSTLIDNLPDSVYVKDTKGRFLLGNKELARRFNLDNTQAFIGKTDYDFFDKEQADRCYEHEQKTINSGEPLLNYQEKVVRQDGTIRWLFTSKIPLKDAKGQVTGIVGLGHDITESKQAKDSLQESEEHYRMLAETMNDGLGQIDENGIYVYVNNKLGEMLGLRPDEMVGRHWTNFYDEQAQKIIKEQLLIRTTGAAEPYELSTIRRDGQKIYIRISPQAIFDEDGKFRGCFSVATDITKRKKAEEEIENLAKFPAQNPYPVLRISRSGEVLYANLASSSLVNDWTKHRWQNMVVDSIDCGSKSQIEIEHQGRIFLFSVVPILGSDHANIYGLDITDRKNAELNLVKNQVQLKALASQLTLAEESERRRIAGELHDRVCQSLAFSKIKIETFRKHAPSPEIDKAMDEVAQLLGQVIRDTRSLTFDLSSPILYEKGFEAAVEEWVEEEIAKKHKIRTLFEDDEQLKPISDDIKVLMFRNVRELLINVTKHANATEVKVCIRKLSSQFEVTVNDNGIGFDPIHTAKMSARNASFGLFSIRERLEELGGQLEIDSEPGQGCKITMTAPLERQKDI